MEIASKAQTMDKTFSCCRFAELVQSHQALTVDGWIDLSVVSVDMQNFVRRHEPDAADVKERNKKLRKEVKARELIETGRCVLDRGKSSKYNKLSPRHIVPAKSEVELFVHNQSRHCSGRVSLAA